jgi:NADH dehydrogenase FAD-containing subunit
MSEKKQIVILGAGYAGVMTAVRLAGKTKRMKQVAITLVNGSDHFNERPRLHEIATGKRPPPRPLVEMLTGTGVQLCQGMVTALQPGRKQVVVQTAAGETRFSYDYLVYALGSRVDRESVPGVRAWAYTLDAVGTRTADPLHQRLQELAGKGGQVLVVGSGPSGIEIAGEIRDTFPALDVSIVTGSEFGSFTVERVRRYMRRALNRLNVQIKEQSVVTEVRERELALENGSRLAYDLCVWAGGFKGGSLLPEAGMEVNRQNRLMVDPYLRSLSYADIYAVGDAALPVEETGAPARMSLFYALVTAAHATDNLVNVLKGKKQRPFGFSTYGQGIAIGRHDAVGFNSFPNDRPVGPLVTGRVGLAVRNFFVWLILRLLTVERTFPGFFFWPGRNRGKAGGFVSAELVVDN